MPSLFRLLFTLALLAVTTFAGLWAIVLLVEPRPRDVTVLVTPPPSAGATMAAPPSAARPPEPAR